MGDYFQPDYYPFHLSYKNNGNWCLLDCFKNAKVMYLNEKKAASYIAAFNAFESQLSSFLFIFLVQSESGCTNVISAAPCLAEPQQYEVQFGRLRNFLTGG